MGGRRTWRLRTKLVGDRGRVGRSNPIKHPSRIQVNPILEEIDPFAHCYGERSTRFNSEHWVRTVVVGDHGGGEFRASPGRGVRSGIYTCLLNGSVCFCRRASRVELSHDQARHGLAHRLLSCTLAVKISYEIASGDLRVRCNPRPWRVIRLSFRL